MARLVTQSKAYKTLLVRGSHWCCCGRGKWECESYEFMPCRYKNNVLLTAARAMLVGLQGVWFIQIAYILFRSTAPPPFCPSSLIII